MSLPGAAVQARRLIAVFLLTAASAASELSCSVAAFVLSRHEELLRFVEHAHGRLGLIGPARRGDSRDPLWTLDELSATGLMRAGSVQLCGLRLPGAWRDTAGDGCVTPQCHARLLEAAAGARVGSVHQPAADGECVSCHDLALPSGRASSEGRRPATADGPESAPRLGPGALLGVSRRGAPRAECPGAATGFADGKRNLHALHVQAGRGRRCLPCHDPHAARQPKLLRERIPARGKARIAQEFRGEPKGGWCKTGCHAPKRYTRPPVSPESRGVLIPRRTCAARGSCAAWRRPPGRSGRPSPSPRSSARRGCSRP